MHFSSRLFLSPLFVRLLALLGTCLWLRSAPALAESPQILVVSGEEVPEKLYEAVSDALGDLGSVMSPSAYSGRTRSQAPDSEEALTKIAPQMGASLIVVLQPARNKLKVALHDGHTGKVIKQTSVPARGKRPKLGGPARKRLVAAAKRALSKVGPAPAPAAMSSSSSSTRSDDEFDDEPSPPPAARAATTPTRPSQPARNLAPVKQAEADEADDMFEDSSESSDEEAPARDEVAAKSDKSVWFPLHAGIGLGSRSILVPTQPMFVGGNRIDTAFAPALDLGAGLWIALGPSWQLRALLTYRTVLALNAAYQTPMGVKSLSSLSSHSVIVGASLGHLSDGLDSFGFHVFLGWAYRGLTPAERSLPSASIQGVVLRPELEIPIANRKLTLRLAPELILVLAQAATLPANNSGVAGGVGYALGAEVELAFHISQSVAISAQFRESRGASPSSWGSSEVENERYIMLRFQLRF